MAQTLKGVRILSLALNLPGPAALMRCRQMGARCVKLEAPPREDAAKAGGATTSSDPMALYNRSAFDAMHRGIRTVQADLKTTAGQKALHRELAKSDVLITSFRPSALKKLGLQWSSLRERYPRLSLVEIVGAPGARAEEPGHDLTYLAESGLVPGLELPATLYADMGGSLMACEAVLQARLQQLQKGRRIRLEVALSEAARYLAQPRTWGLTQPDGAVGGAHAGYRLYLCKDGRVALAALEPHFARRIADAAGIASDGMGSMLLPSTHQAIAGFMAANTCAELDKLALAKDIPLLTLPHQLRVIEPA